MSISTDDLGRITQQTAVLSSDGDRLGTINQVYTSDSTGKPAWVTLKTGLFGTQESFVPLADASFDGDDIRVPVTKKAVHDAPRVDADGHLSVEEEDDLYRYYGLHNPGQPGGGEAGVGRRDDDRDDVRSDALRDDDRDDVRSDNLGNDRDDDRDVQTGDSHGGHAAGLGAGVAGAAAAVTGHDRDRDRDVDVDRDDDRSVHAEDGPERAVDDHGTGSDDRADVRPGERTTQLRRYVVTERVVQTIEELPDEPSR